MVFQYGELHNTNIAECVAMKLPTIEEAKKRREERKKRNWDAIRAIITGVLLTTPVFILFLIPGGDLALPYERETLIELQKFCQDNNFDDGYFDKDGIYCGIEIDYATPPNNTIQEEVLYENGQFRFVDFNGTF